MGESPVCIMNQSDITEFAQTGKEVGETGLDRDKWVGIYRHVSSVSLPKIAQAHDGYPVYLDHCFQRIILDNIFCGEWYDYLDKPAYENLSAEEAWCAAKLGLMMEGRPDLVRKANQNSLRWRGKL